MFKVFAYKKKKINNVEKQRKHMGYIKSNVFCLHFRLNTVDFLDSLLIMFYMLNNYNILL